MRIDDKRAAEIAERVAKANRVEGDFLDRLHLDLAYDVPDLLADRAEREHEIAVRDRALEIAWEHEGMACPEECVNQARAELANKPDGAKEGE